MRRLGARAITALVVPRREVAWQILALNTEKAHNLRERALEVIRILRGLVEEDAARPESSFAFYLEEASLATLGLCYERNPKFAGGAYNPIVRRLETFSDEPLAKAMHAHEKHAEQLMALEERVAEVVAKLKARGFVSPYLRAFVVARINPLRWVKGEPPELAEVLKTMRERAAKFNVDKVKQEDLAGAAGAPDEQD
jgi:ParB family chromosome partitioning protein